MHLPIRATLRWQAAVLAASLLVCAPRMSAAQDQRAILDVVINEVKKGESLVLIEPPDRLWLSVTFLDANGVRGLSGRRRSVDGLEYVALASLAPDVTAVFDERALLVRLTIAPQRLAATTIHYQDRPQDLEFRQDTSLFVNYAVNAQHQGQPGLFVETGLSTRAGLFMTGLSRSTAQPFVRGLTQWTLDDRRRMRRWIVGDAFADSGLLGGTALVGGISVGREYGLDPYFVQYPTLNYAGTTTTPSTLEVYVNDRLVRREELPPGPFELRELQIPNGRGEARFVVRDAFGREQEVSSPFYLSTATLTRGEHDYRYSLGFVRNDTSFSSWEYGKPALLARHRVGVTSWLTAGVRVEAQRHMTNVGPLLAVRMPFGEVQATGAISRFGATTDLAGAIAYRLVTRGLSLGASLANFGPRFTNVSLDLRSDRPRLETNAFLTLPMPRGHLSLQQSFLEQRDGMRTWRSSVAGYLPLTARSFVNMSLARASREQRSAFEVFVGLGVFFANQTSANLAYDFDGVRARTQAELQRSLPVGVGYGYRVRVDDGDTRGGSGAFVYQNRYGRYEVTSDVVAGGATAAVSAAGGLVLIGGSLHATRPLQDSYALVRVPGVANVRAYLSNQEVGRTNHRGELLVPNLLAYYGNLLAIDDHDVPIELGLSRTGTTVAPPYRGGALLTFPVQRGQRSTGIVLLRKGAASAIPAYGQLTIVHDGQEIASPIGARGEFYLDAVPPGRYTGRLEFRGTVCEVPITIPAATAPVVGLGTIVCTARDKEP